MPEKLSANTVDELLTLAKFWTQEALDIQFFEFLSSTSEVKDRSYAWHQVSCISALLGDDVVNKAVEEATQTFGKSRDPRAWEIFMHSDEAAQQAFQYEVQLKLDEPKAEGAGRPRI